MYDGVWGKWEEESWKGSKSYEELGEKSKTFVWGDGAMPKSCWSG